ncbi:MAG: RlmE family RNA methyltransferase [Pyrinomonadaceae bacterium]|nr:RlmE family RNA methyltransferase [Phycisphaerales bacterium]
MAQARKLHDHYFKQAKAEGYLARSAYKLKEIIQKRQLLKRGDRVLDLGCAPGSWLQVASETIGDRGVVVGLDLQAVDTHLGANVKTLQGDVFKTEPAQLLALSGKSTLFDVVLSDMAPNTTGDGDHFRSVELCRRVLAILPGLLKAGGKMTMKVFEGEEYPSLLKEVKLRFTEVKGFKPDATRDVSKEMYIIGVGYKPPVRKSEASKQPPAVGEGTISQ